VSHNGKKILDDLILQSTKRTQRYQNLIIFFLGHIQTLQIILAKSVHNLLSYLGYQRADPKTLPF